MTTTATAPSVKAAQAIKANGPSRRMKVGGNHLGIAAWIIGLIFIIPVFFMVLTSFHREAEASTNPPTSSRRSPWRATGSSSGAAPGRARGRTCSTRSTASVISTILVLVLAIPAAYALSVRPVKKWTDVMFFFLSTKMLPIVAGLLPIYLFAEKSVLLEQHLVPDHPVHRDEPADRGLDDAVVPGGHPVALFEAAALDGAGLIKTLRRIVAPIAMPGIAATALICFIFALERAAAGEPADQRDQAPNGAGVPDQLRHLAGPVPGQGVRGRRRGVDSGAGRRLRRPGQARTGPVPGRRQVATARRVTRGSRQLEFCETTKHNCMPELNTATCQTSAAVPIPATTARRSRPASSTSGSAGSTGPTRRCTSIG